VGDQVSQAERGLARQLASGAEGVISPALLSRTHALESVVW